MINKDLFIFALSQYVSNNDFNANMGLITWQYTPGLLIRHDLDARPFTCISNPYTSQKISIYIKRLGSLWKGLRIEVFLHNVIEVF